MGAKEILAYRSREVMTARQFVGLWLEEHPDDDPHDAALVLAEVVEAETFCIYIPNSDPKLDVWDTDTGAARRKLQGETAAALRRMVAERRDLVAAPSVSLSREGLVKAFAAIEIPGPRFLYPPAPSSPAVQPHPQGTLGR